MKAPKRTDKTKKYLIIFGSLLVPIIALVCLRQSPELIEQYYFTHVYKWVSYLTHPVFGVIPYSIGDVVYTVVGFFLLTGIVMWFTYLFTKRFKLMGLLTLRFFICLEVGWLWFYCFWGLNYYRPPAANLLALNDTTYTIKDVAKVTSLIIDSANTLRLQLDNFAYNQSDDDIYLHAREAVTALGDSSAKFRAVSPLIKPSWFSYLLNYIGTSGYYNPFTNEAQLNNLMPTFDKPFVACHEMGHQTGWAREDEANFAGYLAGTNAKDKLLRYSAYYVGVEEFMRYLRRRDTAAHHALRLKILPLVMDDFKADSAYWTKYQGGAEVVSGLFFDKFLKANNQPHGLRTYNRMIRLTMSYYRKRYRVW